MREDMFKVIVERPRKLRGKATKSKLRYVKGDGRNRMSGKRIVTEHNGDTKWLNENLAPLKRYFMKQCGRRWDDVFSEICANLDTGSTVKMHVREHIDDFIERTVREAPDGTLISAGHWGSPETPERWADLYVDPRDGIIKETRRLCRKIGVPTRREYWAQCRREYNNTENGSPLFRRVTDTIYLVQVQGLWYQFELASKPLTPSGFTYSDKELRRLLSQASWHDDTAWRVIAKQQLSKKQLKARGLSNVMEGEYE